LKLTNCVPISGLPEVGFLMRDLAGRSARAGDGYLLHRSTNSHCFRIVLSMNLLQSSILSNQSRPSEDPEGGCLETLKTLALRRRGCRA
jgi:hypothetical protein